jgi:hypothetical protein
VEKFGSDAKDSEVPRELKLVLSKENNRPAVESIFLIVKLSDLTLRRPSEAFFVPELNIISDE